MSSLAYTLSIASRQRHTFAVSMTIPALAPSATSLTLSLPAWIPGSYMVRDFARHILSLEVTDSEGNALQARKTDKQTWRVDTNGNAVTVNYEVFAFDLSVRSAYINDEYAFCNGTSVFLCVEGQESLPCSLTVKAGNDQLVETGMPKRADREYHCDNYLEFIDHPIFIGQADTLSFDVNGIEFVMLFSGQNNIDIHRICEAMKPICAHHLSLFDKPWPMERYVFMTLVSDAGFGGLEHYSSTALLYPRMDLPQKGERDITADGYITFLSLCSHELFHTWHVKRIKPQVMVNPDLSGENYTDQLWIYEGFTSFYDDLTLARAGTISPAKYLEIVGQNLTKLMQTPGRNLQGAAESSFDAWTRFYKQDASSVNHIVSYYVKGGIIAFGLDLLLRDKTSGSVTLDNVMKALWEQYGRDESGTPDNVIETICKTQFNVDVSDYLNHVVFGREDVPLTTWLQDIGVSLHYRTRQAKDDKGGTPPSGRAAKHQFGAAYKGAETGVTVLQVRDHTPASAAGLQINDRVIALNDRVVSDAQLQRLLDTASGESVALTVLREGRLLRLTLPVKESPKDIAYFKIEDEALLKAWLGL